MKSTIVFLAIVGALVSQCHGIDYNNPVRSAAEDEMKSLPGLNYSLNFKHYSGYVRADDGDSANLFFHYWFVESQSNPDKDPIVLWLNGGPGCSSMLGLMTELGPYTITDEGQVVKNPYAWNKRANVVFLESPAGVGFSYALDGNTNTNDDATAKHNHQALRNFFEKFPQYKNRPLYLTGESYGGVYLPTLAVLVDADETMNLKGVGIGNGYLDATKLSESLIFFSYYHGLVGKTVWNDLSQYCCGGHPPARGKCHFFDASDAKCSASVSQAANDILNIGINPYNLYDRCASVSSTSYFLTSVAEQTLSREHVDKSLAWHHFKNLETRRLKGSNRKLEILHDEPPCTDDSTVINYLNRPEARIAIHVPEKLDVKFATCAEINYTMIYPGQKGGLAPFVRKLLASPRKLNLLVYNGDTDMMCNFLGDEWFVDDLNQKLIHDYEPWHVKGQVAGFVKKFHGITYMTVKGSGHMVPTDRPVEALYMFENYLLEL